MLNLCIRRETVKMINIPIIHYDRECDDVFVVNKMHSFYWEHHHYGTLHYVDNFNKIIFELRSSIIFVKRDFFLFHSRFIWKECYEQTKTELYRHIIIIILKNNNNNNCLWLLQRMEKHRPTLKFCIKNSLITPIKIIITINNTAICTMKIHQTQKLKTMKHHNNNIKSFTINFHFTWKTNGNRITNRGDNMPN